MDCRSSFRKLRYHILLMFRGLNHNSLKLCFRNREIQLVRGLDVCHFLEHIHQFRKVEELGKSGSGTIAGSLRCKLNGSRCFTKGRCPGVKMGQILFLERTVLEITHDRIKLGHGVADGSTRGEDNTTTAGDLVHIAAFHKHIRRFLSFRSGQTCHIPHFGVEEQVLERMALIHEQSVNAQLLKGDYIVFLVCGKELIQSGFQRFSGFLHLLDGEVFATLPFQFCDCSLDLVNLLSQLSFLSFRRKRNTLELAVTDDNCIIVAGCNTGAELLTVCGLKIFLRGNKQFCTRIEVQELICPL